MSLDVSELSSPRESVSTSRMSWDDQQNLCISIAEMYWHKFKVSPPNKWDGKGGVIAQIRDAFGMAQGSKGTVQNVLNNVYKLEGPTEDQHKNKSKMTVYNAACKPREYLGPYLIERGGDEEQMIADIYERGMGKNHAYHTINTIRLERGE